MQKINQINQYLLERFPNIWNTRIVWMLLLGIAVHFIFFFIGFVSHASPGTLQHTRAIDDYFSTGLVFVHVIISVLLIVGWLIYMLKNNAFKNFYPSSGKKLFFEFVQYFVIIFVSVTFYFSYMTGFRIFINYKYDDDKMSENIEIINHSVPFLSQNLEDYTLENRLSPKPFADFYCETDINKIDKTRPYFVYHDRVYQYFSLYEKTVNQTDERGQFIYPAEEKKKNVPLAYFENSADNKSRTYFFKKQVEDLSPFIKTVAPSYYNYSSVFYDNVNNPSENGRKYIYDNNISKLPDKEVYKQKQIEVNGNTIRLITSKDSKALEQLLKDFLRVSKEFGIVTNLNVKDWSAMVYHPEKFEVKQFIMLYKPDSGTDYDPNKAPAERYNDYEVAVTADSTAAYEDNYLAANGEIQKDTINIRDFNPNVDREIAPEDYFKRNVSHFYYYTQDLKNLLENVDTIKSDDFFSDSVHLFIWIAFALAILIFSFRVTDLRALLFSIISAGVIILLVTLFCVFFSFVGGFKNAFFILYTILTVGVIILLIPLITIGKARKIVTSIFMIISMVGFPLFIWLIFGIVNEHQVSDCRTKVYIGDNYLNCKGVLDNLGLTSSYIMLISTFVFLYFYTGFVKKWKAIPE